MSVPAAQLPRPGDMIAGKYVLDRLLGQGGMGAVFAARHLKLSKAVAIKIMLADSSSPEASQRFINEGRAAANIQNEHVVRVDDVDEEMGYAYMVLELLEGKDLAQVLEAEPAKRLPPHVAVGYVLQGCKGVMQAHAIGIVHRDLKPSNLFLAKRKDGSDIVKVLDFGISKAQGSSALAASPNALTSTKAMLGSPLYMSPEQLRNAKSVDHRADIWAMGVILYELMTGALPFMGDNLGELFAAILETDPLPLRQRIGDGVPPGLNEVVVRCLQRRPEQRFQSVAELVQALAPFERPIMSGAGTAVGMGPHQATAYMAQTPAHSPGPSHPSGPQPMFTGQATGGHLAATPGTNPGTPPVFNQTTGSGWQTQGTAPGAPKSKLPMVLVAVFAAVATIGIVLGVLVVTGKHSSEDVSAGKHPPPPVSSLLASPDPPVTAVQTAEPPPVPVESASAAVSAPPPPPVVPVNTHHSSSPAVKPPPPAPALPPAPAPVSKPPNGGKQPAIQENR